MNWRIMDAEFDGDTVQVKLSDGNIEVEILADVVALTQFEAILDLVHIQGPGPNRVGLRRIRSLPAWLKGI